MVNLRLDISNAYTSGFRGAEPAPPPSFRRQTGWSAGPPAEPVESNQNNLLLQKIQPNKTQKIQRFKKKFCSLRSRNIPLL